MDYIKIKNENELELTVTNLFPKDYEVIMGGMDVSPDWEEYLSYYVEEVRPHFMLIKKAIEELGWVGSCADKIADNTCFVFSDDKAVGFTWRAWGDLMSAIVGKNEGYIAYYM